MKIDPVELTRKLISFESITPEDSGAIEYIATIFKKSGFDCEILEFGDKVKNLYAKYIMECQICALLGTLMLYHRVS